MEANKKRQIIELRAQGKSYNTIAKEAKVAKQTAIDICKACEEEIATLKAMELEALYETHNITQQGRIERLSSLRDMLRAEIERRDLTDIPTDKLVSLYLNTESSLKEELIEPHFQSSEEQERDRVEREVLDKLTSFQENRK